MAKDNNGSLTKREITFWVSIIGIVVTFTIAFVKVQSQVQVNAAAQERLRQEFDSSYILMQDVRERVIGIEKDIQYIKDAVSNK